MGEINTNKKVWVQPAVQMLSISKDTYSSKARGNYETGNGKGDANENKHIPS